MDEEIMSKSRAKYKELGLPRSEKKAFDKSYSFKAWGTSVDSCSGRIGTPTEKLRQIESLATALLSVGQASKKALQKLIGLYIHPFMHRRECMSVFHHIYVFLENLREGVLYKLPHHIRDELAAACLLLPLSFSNVRWPVSVQISATDASLTGGVGLQQLPVVSLQKPFTVLERREVSLQSLIGHHRAFNLRRRWSQLRMHW